MPRSVAEILKSQAYVDVRLRNRELRRQSLEQGGRCFERVRNLLVPGGACRFRLMKKPDLDDVAIFLFGHPGRQMRIACSVDPDPEDTTMRLSAPPPFSLTIHLEVFGWQRQLTSAAAKTRGGRWRTERRGPGLRTSRRVGERSDGAQIVRRGLAGLAVGDELVGNLLALVEGVHAGALDC